MLKKLYLQPRSTSIYCSAATTPVPPCRRQLNCSHYSNSRSNSSTSFHNRCSAIWTTVPINWWYYQLVAVELSAVSPPIWPLIRPWLVNTRCLYPRSARELSTPGTWRPPFHQAPSAAPPRLAPCTTIRAITCAKTLIVALSCTELNWIRNMTRLKKCLK